MLKRLLALLFPLLCSMAIAQTTTVTGTLVDPSGNTWSNATITPIFTSAPGIPGPYNWSGGVFNPLPPTITTGSGGAYTFTLPSSTSIVPSGSTWVFNVCPNASLQCAIVNISVSGTTFDLGAAITSSGNWPIGFVTYTPIAKAYNINQVGNCPPINQSALFYNTTNQTMNVCTNTGWELFASVGGFPVVTNPAGTQTITQPGNSNFNVIVSGTGAFNVITSFGASFNLNGSQVLNASNGCGLINCLTISSGVIKTSTTSQNIAQQGTSSLNVSTLNGVFNPTLCGSSNAPNWCQGTDLGAWINAAFTICSNSCTAQIPSGTWVYTTTIQMSKISQSIVGSGSGNTILNYTGSSDGLLWQMNPFTTNKAGALRGLTFECTASAINCIHSGSIVGSTWDDVVVYGATSVTSGSGTGILLENANIAGVASWTERTYMHNVHIGISGISNTVGVKLLLNGGTNSFGYSDFDIWFNVGPSQTGFLVGAGIALYHSNVTIKGNIDGNGGAIASTFYDCEGFQIAGTFNLFGEYPGSTVSNPIVVGAAGIVYAQGQVVFTSGGAQFPYLPTIASGGSFNVTPWLAFDTPGASISGTTQPIAMIQKATLPISSDGTLVVASGEIRGRVQLSWPSNASRYQELDMDVSCSNFEGTQCYLSIPVNAVFNQQFVFSNPRLVLSSGAPQLLVTVGNRNGVSQNITATYYGSIAEQTTLFPNITAGTTAVPFVGVPVVGQPTVGQTACVKAAGPPVILGFCSTIVGSDGACTCN